MTSFPLISFMARILFILWQSPLWNQLEGRKSFLDHPKTFFPGTFKMKVEKVIFPLIKNSNLPKELYSIRPSWGAAPFLSGTWALCPDYRFTAFERKTPLCDEIDEKEWSLLFLKKKYKKVESVFSGLLIWKSENSKRRMMFLLKAPSFMELKLKKITMEDIQSSNWRGFLYYFGYLSLPFLHFERKKEKGKIRKEGDKANFTFLAFIEHFHFSNYR